VALPTLQSLVLHRHARTTAALPAVPDAVIEEKSMKSNEQETGRPGVQQVISAAQQQVISAAQQQRAMHLKSAPKEPTAAWAGLAGIALLILGALLDFAVNCTNDVDSAAYATVSTAAAAMPSAEYAFAVRIGEAAAAPAKPDASLPAADSDTDRGGGSDGNVMTYEHD
jgi:hypothetical protein